MRKFLIILFVFSIGLGTSLGVVFAQSQAEVEKKRKELERELDKVEEEIAQNQSALTQLRGQTQSIERDIAILTAEINEAKLKIRAHEINIQELGKDITTKEKSIQELNATIERGKDSLAEIIRKTHEIDEYSLVEIMLSNQDLSEFLEDVNSFLAVKRDLQELFEEVRGARSQEEEQKEELGVQQDNEINAKFSVEAEKAKIEAKEQEKQRLLALKKSQEQSYEQIINIRKKRAAEIRSALFALRDTAAIPFGDALAFAEEASEATGVRVAFILGILKQESDLGANVGQCYLRDPETGDGVGANTGRIFEGVMHPTRDVPPFLAIAEELGFDPYNQVVSCPQWIGYGGAMGPSQFIPSTWNIYKHRVASALGVSVANPWEPRHAFTATALFLADLGASRGTYASEREAAARYFAGGYWQENGLGYAASVLSHAEDIQVNMIDPLKNL